MKYLEYTLFPKLVLLCQYERDFKKEFEYIKNINYKNRVSNNKYLLYEPEMKNLKKFFQEAINFYITDKLKSNQKIGISQSWATVINKGEGFSAYNHPNSLINGCFYFNTDGTTPPLTLINNRKESLYPYSFESSEHNLGSFDLRPGPGQLILFPNILDHKVSNSTSDITRRSLAFNTFMLDTLGNEELMTEINLEKIKKNNS